MEVTWSGLDSWRGLDSRGENQIRPIILRETKWIFLSSLYLVHKNNPAHPKHGPTAQPEGSPCSRRRRQRSGAYHCSSDHLCWSYLYSSYRLPILSSSFFLSSFPLSFFLSCFLWTPHCHHFRDPIDFMNRTCREKFITCSLLVLFSSSPYYPFHGNNLQYHWIQSTDEQMIWKALVANVPRGVSNASELWTQHESMGALMVSVTQHPAAAWIIALQLSQLTAPGASLIWVHAERYLDTLSSQGKRCYRLHHRWDLVIISESSVRLLQLDQVLLHSECPKNMQDCAYAAPVVDDHNLHARTRVKIFLSTYFRQLPSLGTNTEEKKRGTNTLRDRTNDCPYRGFILAAGGKCSKQLSYRANQFNPLQKHETEEL